MVGKLNVRVVDYFLENLAVDREKGSSKWFGLIHHRADRRLKYIRLDRALDPAQHADLPLRGELGCFCGKPYIELPPRQRKNPVGTPHHAPLATPIEVLPLGRRRFTRQRLLAPKPELPNSSCPRGSRQRERVFVAIERKSHTRENEVSVLFCHAIRESARGEPAISVLAVLGQLEAPGHVFDVDFESDEMGKQFFIAGCLPAQSVAAAIRRRCDAPQTVNDGVFVSQYSRVPTDFHADGIPGGQLGRLVYVRRDISVWPVDYVNDTATAEKLD